MEQINLKAFPYFRQLRALTDLNLHVGIHNDFMPHQIAVATGCSLETAMGILLLAFNQSLVDAKLLVYHNTHPETPWFLAQNIVDGFPNLPLVCSVCDAVIERDEELSYDFLFKPLATLRFVVDE
jgi:hypothetical protein